MICKITQGSGFEGAVNYVMGKDGAELLDSKDVRSYDSKLVTKDFEMISKQNLRVKRPVMHLSVSFHKDDISKLTNDKMKLIANEIINGMGFNNAQYIVVKHTDAAHPHFHIITSRVDMDLKTVSDKHNFAKLNKLRIQIEKAYPELISTNGKNITETNTKKLKGKDSVKYKIYNAIKVEIQKSSNIEMLIKNLEVNHGVKTELKYRRGSIGVVEGIKFQKDNTWLSGSKIDKSCSYLNLLKQLKENKNEISIGAKVEKHSIIHLNNRLIAAVANKLTSSSEETFNGAKKRSKNQDEELER